MSKQLKLIVNNYKSNHPTKPDSKLQSLGMSLPTIHYQRQLQDSQLLQQKIYKLQGNLNMLQKKYKSNLKDGFDNKIKAYRMAAAIQRKLLKNTIEETHKYQLEEQIKQKILMKQKEKQMQLYRQQMAKFKMQQKQKFIRIRNIRDKKRNLITMQQRRRQYSQSLKKNHDQILLQQQNINKKREYFDYIKKQIIKKDEYTQKKQVLGKLIQNNQRLKILKDSLYDIKEGMGNNNNTFLTI